MSDYILELNNITKNFPGVKALDNANFRLKKKSIHALLGENGAGKSTLIKIITGVYNQNEGKLFLNNQEKSFSSPNEAMNAGISVVHQERNLIRRFSVGENLMLTNLPKNNLGLIDYNTVAKESKKWLDIMELDIDPNTIVSDLTVAKMQLCEIAKALSLESKILLLDEPTSSLSPQDTKNLFAFTFFWSLVLNENNIDIASAAAVLSSKRDAFASSIPVRSATMVWKFKRASNLPWAISAWYGV